jgi:predicted membrane channel-forming protein YqfA (hemolysin III family)
MLYQGDAQEILPSMPGLGEFIVIMLILSMTVVWLWMLFDCLRYEPDKVVWLLIIVFTGIVGAFIYLFARRRPRRRTVI